MPQKHEIYGYLILLFFENILQEKKNGLSLKQQKLQVIMYHIITRHEHFISSLPDKTNAPQKTENTFIFL